jgi:hypothetical protein
MAEVAAMIGKVVATIVMLATFIVGLLVAIDPADIGIMILQAFKVAIPNPMVDQFIMELRVLGAAASILGFVAFIASLYYLWKE